MTPEKKQQVESEAEKKALELCRSCNDRGYYGPCECHNLQQAFVAGAQYRETMDGDAVAFVRWMENKGWLASHSDANGEVWYYNKSEGKLPFEKVNWMRFDKLYQLFKRESTTPDSEVKRMRDKYVRYVSNIEWHINNNQPDKNQIANCRIKIECYNEILKDLQALNPQQ